MWEFKSLLSPDNYEGMTVWMALTGLDKPISPEPKVGEQTKFHRQVVSSSLLDQTTWKSGKESFWWKKVAAKVKEIPITEKMGLNMSKSQIEGPQTA